jgi:hypothetical protein
VSTRKVERRWQIVFVSLSHSLISIVIINFYINYNSSNVLIILLIIQMSIKHLLNYIKNVQLDIISKISLDATKYSSYGFSSIASCEHASQYEYPNPLACKFKYQCNQPIAYKYSLISLYKESYF